MNISSTPQQPKTKTKKILLYLLISILQLLSKVSDRFIFTKLLKLLLISEYVRLDELPLQKGECD
jgi:hypothetical protein